MDLDVSNGYWSINMAREWGDIFGVSVQGRAFRWSTLLFGWKYHLIFCQHLMKVIMGNAVVDLPVMPFVYLDGVPVAGSNRELRTEVRRMKAQLHKTKVVLRPKI